MSKIDEVKELSAFLSGVSIATQMIGNSDGAEKFKKASKWLRVLSREICCQGYICRGGQNCTSDHK